MEKWVEMKLIKGKIFFLLGLLAIAVMTMPANAAINTIGAGNTVFIGEEGLNIAGAVAPNNQIAWFPSTAIGTSSVPEKIIDVTTIMTSFSISPSDFSSRTGNWYSWNAGSTAGTAPVAFRVVDPSLDLKVEDATVNVDVTGKWAPRYDELRFRIETNLYDMAQRAGVAGAPVTIKVQSPGGAVFTELIDKLGTSHSLVEIPVGTTPFTTVNFWDTGNAIYKSGTYTVWAECNANQMKDNYNQPGKTSSVPGNLVMQDQNPLISANTATTPPTTQQTATVTTETTAVITTTPPPTVPATGTFSPVQTSVLETAAHTEAPAPSQTPTRAAGFSWICVIGALFIGYAVITSWKR
jgi:hypothetical protein